MVPIATEIAIFDFFLIVVLFFIEVGPSKVLSFPMFVP